MSKIVNWPQYLEPYYLKYNSYSLDDLKAEEKRIKPIYDHLFYRCHNTLVQRNLLELHQCEVQEMYINQHKLTVLKYLIKEWPKCKQ